MAGIGKIFSAMDINVSALQAQRQRIDVIDSNLANAESTRAGGRVTAYRRQQVVFEAVMDDVESGASSDIPWGGVRVSEQTTDPTRKDMQVYLPGHPDADSGGYVKMPDIRPAEEMADLMAASRSYEANAAAFKITRSMFQRALELGKA